MDSTRLTFRSVGHSIVEINLSTLLSAIVTSFVRAYKSERIKSISRFLSVTPSLRFADS